MFGISPITPAYGRDYKSKKEVEADFYSDKDFLTSNGQYINKSQLINDCQLATIQIRFKKLKNTIVIPTAK